MRSAKRTKALLLAGGLGTRLRPLTDELPKCLAPIAGRPLLDYWIDRLDEAGISLARINTHAHAGQVRDYIAGVNERGGARLVESHEPELLGSAGTVAANADLADDADVILIVYADNLSDVDLGSFIRFHEGHDAPFSMMLFRAPNPRACGIAELDGEARIVSFVEKPENPSSDLANAGLYAVDAEAYREMASLKAFDLGFEVLPRFTGRMRGWLWGGYHLDIGNHAALEQARRDAASVFPGNAARGGSRRRGVFLDRDGTLIEHVHYLDDPSRVRLAPGVGDALRRLRRAGFARVVVTNQSAVGRGRLTLDRLGEIHVELERRLASEGASVDAIYYCPDAPVGDDRTVVENPDRKPGPGMLKRGASELGLDLGGSWMIGDLISDVLAGLNAGCRSILVESGQATAADHEAASGRALVARDMSEAVEKILENEGVQA